MESQLHRAPGLAHGCLSGAQQKLQTNKLFKKYECQKRPQVKTIEASF